MEWYAWATSMSCTSSAWGTLPAEMSDDTAWTDRIHCYLPGWDVPKMNRELTTDHFGLVSDFFAECLNMGEEVTEAFRVITKAAI
ncbi:hypothetical protein D3C78_840260 [compost metagenome]